MVDSGRIGVGELQITNTNEAADHARNLRYDLRIGLGDIAHGMINSHSGEGDVELFHLNTASVMVRQAYGRVALGSQCSQPHASVCVQDALRAHIEEFYTRVNSQPGKGQLRLF